MNFENILIKKTEVVEKKPVQILEDKYSKNKTLRERFIDLANECVDSIKQRNIKQGISNANKYEHGATQNFRTLRMIESMFQNSALRMVIGRDRFFSNNELSDQKAGFINTAAIQMYKQLGDESFAQQEAQKVSRGIEAVYRYVREIHTSHLDEKENFFVGTNDYLDAAHSIDLLVQKENDLDLVQIKNTNLSQDGIDDIHTIHNDFLKSSDKDAIEYIHVLVENYTKNIDEKDPELYGEFIEYLQETHSFLEWVKPLYDEQDHEKNIIDDDFLKDTLIVSEMENIDLSQVAVLFQKGDILHNIFMQGGGDYSKLFNLILEKEEVLPKKERVKIKQQGMASVLYDDSFFEKINNEIFSSEEQKKFSEYIMLMRELDQWSLAHIEGMNHQDSIRVFKKFNTLIGIDENLFVQNNENIYSVVVHGDKVSKKKLT